MQKPADAPSKATPFRPQPNSLAETGLDFGQIVDLALKTMRFSGRLSSGELANRMGMPFVILEPLFAFLKREKLMEVVGAGSISEQLHEYALSDKGYEKASEAIERNAYVGPAPVPLAEYVEVIKEQSVRKVHVTPDEVRDSLADLELAPSIRRLIGAAINGGHSILLYGKPGNGKSSVAKRITKMMGEGVIIPYAVDVGGQTLRVFDPRVHTEVATSDVGFERRLQFAGQASSERRRDQRWVTIKRPLITVGGELTLHDLDLKYSNQTKFYLPPIQILANCGILVVDDFGRQKMRPDELLNRWIVPMEDGVDHYSLVSGETIEVPFELLLVFSTNLRPETLGDEAFWRRIRHKVEIKDPDERIYRAIMVSECARAGIEFTEEGCAYLFETHYRKRGRELRAVHPRDLLGLMRDMSNFEGSKPEFTPEWIDTAVASYFLEEGVGTMGNYQPKVTL